MRQMWIMTGGLLLVSAAACNLGGSDTDSANGSLKFKNTLHAQGGSLWADNDPYGGQDHGWGDGGTTWGGFGGDWGAGGSDWSGGDASASDGGGLWGGGDDAFGNWSNGSSFGGGGRWYGNFFYGGVHWTNPFIDSGLAPPPDAGSPPPTNPCFNAPVGSGPFLNNPVEQQLAQAGCTSRQVRTFVNASTGNTVTYASAICPSGPARQLMLSHIQDPNVRLGGLGPLCSPPPPGKAVVRWIPAPQ